MVLSFSGLLDTCRGRMCIKFSNMASKITAYASVYATLDIIKLSAICTTKSFQKKKQISIFHMEFGTSLWPGF